MQNHLMVLKQNLTVKLLLELYSICKMFVFKRKITKLKVSLI